MEKFYEIAGLRIRVLTPNAEIYNDEAILGAFAAPPGGFDHSVEISLAESLDAPAGDCVYSSPALRVYSDGECFTRYMGSVGSGWQEGWLRIFRRGNESRVQLKCSASSGHIGAKTVLNSIEAEHLLTVHNGFLLHASFVAWNGRAILFTAPSGTGKSTQAELWRTLRGAEIINGDRAAVRICGGKALAWGLPFAGSSDVRKNTVLPLAAVVYLSQSPETSITRLRPSLAFRRIWEGCSVNAWNREDVLLGSQTVMDLVASVPVCHLACTPDESAVRALESVILSEEKL